MKLKKEKPSSNIDDRRAPRSDRSTRGNSENPRALKENRQETTVSREARIRKEVAGWGPTPWEGKGDLPGPTRSNKSDKSQMLDIRKEASKELNDFVKGRRLPSRTYSK